MSGHLDDDTIDLYVTGRLPAAEEAELELHVLECPSCAERARDVQDLSRGLETGTATGNAWRTVAAVLAAACVTLGVIALRTADRAGGPATGRLVEMRLSALVRGEGTGSLRKADGAAVVVLVADARELAAPGAKLAAEVRTATGERVSALFGLRSSSTGTVRVPVPADRLETGAYVLELRWQAEVLTLPFEIKP